MLNDSVHLTPQRIADLAEGRLGALERSRLERHIAECARCSADLRTIAGPDESANPGLSLQPTMLSRARDLLRQPRGASPPAPPQRHVGALRFDSATMPPAFGIRGTNEPRERQLLFEAGPFEVELHTRGGRGGWNVSGQVLGPTDATGGEVRLIGTRATTRSQLSELLEFHLPPVPDGMYQLELRLLSDALLQIGPLQLRS